MNNVMNMRLILSKFVCGLQSNYNNVSINIYIYIYIYIYISQSVVAQLAIYLEISHGE